MIVMNGAKSIGEYTIVKSPADLPVVGQRYLEGICISVTLNFEIDGYMFYTVVMDENNGFGELELRTRKHKFAVFCGNFYSARG